MSRLKILPMKIRIKSGRVAAFLAALLLIGGGAGVLLTGCGGDHGTAGQAKEGQFYTCGMHPQVIQDKPGNCPICGMKLTPVRKQASASGPTAPGERKVKFYKSTMNPGETSPAPAKDSMGMDMVPVYETEGGASDSQLITVEPMTMQDMNIHTATVTLGSAGPVNAAVLAVQILATGRAGLRAKSSAEACEGATRTSSFCCPCWIRKIALSSALPLWASPASPCHGVP